MHSHPAQPQAHLPCKPNCMATHKLSAPGSEPREVARRQAQTAAARQKESPSRRTGAQPGVLVADPEADLPRGRGDVRPLSFYVISLYYYSMQNMRAASLSRCVIRNASQTIVTHGGVVQPERARHRAWDANRTTRSPRSRS